MLSQRLFSTVNRLAVRNFSSTKPALATFAVQDEAEFKEKVLGSANPVVVDFSAAWCGPCKLLTPRLDAAIAATEGAVDLAIVDIDDLADIALEHGVNAVPTVLGIKDGQIVDKFVGLIDEDKLGAFIARLQS
eukprot:GFUD01015942.1.p1 GENE.GFUD01015942.1~~GFUD01015942.1.p1  ORF type:complete len:133 (-),score=35.06 GFUD01015942.1:162-560(-)